MSYQSGTLVQCPNLQFGLGQIFDQVMNREALPFPEFIRSEDNRNGINITVNPGSGKTRTVELTYWPRLAESSVEETTGRTCAAQEKIGNNVKTYSIDTEDVLRSGERIQYSDLSTFCENNPDYVLRVIARHLDVVDRKIATVISTQAAALLGEWSADVQSNYTMSGDKLQVRTKTSGGTVVAGALETIRTATEMSGFATAVGFGGNLLREHVALSLAGCCSDSGLDLQAILNLYGFAYAYDSRLAAALGSTSTQSLIMAPGALQVLNYVQNPAITELNFVFGNGGYRAFTAVTPAGYDVDVLIKDDCGVVDINVYACVKLVGLPDALFLNGDKYEGVTYAAGVVVNNS
jgi:hypothetical protein